MEKKLNLKKIEEQFAKWLKPIPNLPEKAQKWIGTNIWWMVIILTVLMAISIITSISGMFQALNVMSSVNRLHGVLGNYATGFVVLGAGQRALWISSQILSLIFSIFSLVVYGLAIMPLKEAKKKGWDLLFLVLLVNFVWIVINTILNFNVFTFIPYLVFGIAFFLAAIYLLLQIKNYFVKKDK